VNAAQTEGTAPDLNDETRLEELDAQLVQLDEQLAVLEPLNTLRVDLIGKVARFTALQDAHLKVLDLREQIAQKESELAALPAAPPTEDPAAEQRTSLTAEITTLQEQLAQKQAELDALPPIPTVEDPNAEQRTALLDGITTLKEQLARAEIERDNARNLLIVEKDIVAYDPERVGRMEELKWNGALRDLIRSTIASGRPTSGSYWPRQMPAWSQRAGGPLRDDQIENLVDYILNWQTEFTFESTRHVEQYAIIPAAGTPPIANAVGDDANRIVLELADLEAAAEEGFDSVAGQQSFQSLGCAGCHQVGGTGAGPDLTGVATRAGEHPEYASARAYLVTSIVNPGDFIVAGYSDGIMPADFGKRLDLPTLSNLIAYLESQD
jgi:mono/diheme cytochrome c family protein